MVFIITITGAFGLLLWIPRPIHPASPVDEVSPRAPFVLELPDVPGGTPITATSARVPNVPIRSLRLKILQPYASNINYGRVYTAINGEASNTIQSIRSGRDGQIVTCDLEMKPRFKLKPGKNVVEITAIDDRNKLTYYASYVLLVGAGGTADETGGGTATVETSATDPNNESLVPHVVLTSPKGVLRLNRPTDVAQIQGTVSSPNGEIASLSLNSKPIGLTPVTPGSKVMKFGLSFTPGASRTIVIEARDRAGQWTRLTIPIAKREAAVSSQFSGRKYAVVIGISKYKFNDGGLRDLEYADADARSIRDFLLRPEGGGFGAKDILYLENQDATLDSVRAGLTRFLPQAGPNDLVFIFLAGHGSPDPYAPQSLYFIMHDTKVADMPHTALAMTELQQIIEQQVRAQRLVVFADTCHSAGLSGKSMSRQLVMENNVINLYAAKLYNETGRAVLTSSDVNEISQESKDWGGGHGVFTWALLEGLNGEGDANHDRSITAGELFDFVTDRVRLTTSFRQNPRALAGLNKDLTLAVVK